MPAKKDENKRPSEEGLGRIIDELKKFFNLKTDYELFRCLQAFLIYWPKARKNGADAVTVSVNDVVRKELENIKNFLGLSDDDTDKEIFRVSLIALKALIDVWKLGHKVKIIEGDDFIVDENGEPKFIARGQEIAELRYENGKIQIYRD